MNEATMLLKKQQPSMRKLLRRRTLEREVSVTPRDAHGPLTTQVFIPQRRHKVAYNLEPEIADSLVTVSIVEWVFTEYCGLSTLWNFCG
jgi:hypothetical protein